MGKVFQKSFTYALFNNTKYPNLIFNIHCVNDEVIFAIHWLQTWESGAKKCKYYESESRDSC